MAVPIWLRERSCKWVEFGVEFSGQLMTVTGISCRLWVTKWHSKFSDLLHN